MSAADPPMLKWELGYERCRKNGSLTWVEARVPGAVQLDIARAENYGPWYYAENWRDYLWMEDCEFIYRTRFENPQLEEGQRLLFRSGGIDYAFSIGLNGSELWKQEGMFTPVSLDLTGHLQQHNELLVRMMPVPKAHCKSLDKTQAAESVKPAVSYGWDWHPRLVPLGIWDSTWLEIVPGSHLERVSVTYVMAEELDRVDLTVELSGRELAGRLCRWKLFDDGGGLVGTDQIGLTGDRTVLHTPVKDPELWWPHDQGEPYLYRWSVELTGRSGNTLQQVTGQTGFRRTRLVTNEGAWLEPRGFPKSRSVAPIQLEINGRKIFCRGTNWVNPEVFPGTISGDRYRELLERALEANFNMLRVWGGGIVNKESFYEMCDRMGILVWQEFPLACNKYPDSPGYLEVLGQESVSIITRLRKHPCLAIWSGGNELFNAWSGMTDQSLALRMLNSLCLERDPHTPFISTSPLMGMGHGHYVFRDPASGEEVYSLMNRSRFTAYTEFGMPSPSPVEVLRKIIPEEELWPPRPGTAWESHHAYNAWVGDTWLMQDLIEDYFGRPAGLGELIDNGQLLQCEGYKAIFEEARRQKPYCSTALNWCFNEPWPTAANNSLVNWPDLPKPAFYAVRDACRPVLASTRNRKFSWKSGEEFFAQLWMLNDAPEPLEGGTVRAWLVKEGERVLLGAWEFDASPANENIEGPGLTVELPGWDPGLFKLELEVAGHPAYHSSYSFLLKDT